MKRIFNLMLAAALVLAPATPAMAESFQGKNDWKVTFTTGQKLESNFTNKEWADDIKGDSNGLQPGDDVTFTVTATQDWDGEADWYLANEIIKTLEDGAANAAAAGSKYEYKLSWEGPKASRVIYDSAQVGGTDSAHLKEATNGMKDFFYLDTMKKGQSGKVSINVKFDGETEGNAYFDTIAQLRLKFGVDPVPVTPPGKTTPPPETPPSTPIVKTGDSENLMPLYIAMAVSGGVFALLALYGVRERRRENKEG